MNINDLCNVLVSGTQIKVLSAKTGRVMLVNAAKRRDMFGKLDVFSVEPVIETMSRGTFAKPIITCYALEESYRKIKEV